MPRVSASGGELATHCLAPFGDGVIKVDKTTWSMRGGNAIHEACEKSLDGLLPDLDAIAKKHGLSARQLQMLRGQYSAWLRWATSNHMLNGNVLAERAYAYDPWTDAAKIGPLPEGFDERKHRDYSFAGPDDVVAATLDAVLIQDDRAIVWDWKSGWSPQPPVDSIQLRLQAICVSRFYKVSTVETHIVRISEHDVYDMAPYTVDEWELLEWADRVREWGERFRANDITPTPGAHCKKCKVESCEARQVAA